VNKAEAGANIVSEHAQRAVFLRSLVRSTAAVTPVGCLGGRRPPSPTGVWFRNGVWSESPSGSNERPSGVRGSAPHPFRRVAAAYGNAFERILEPKTHDFICYICSFFRTVISKNVELFESFRLHPLRTSGYLVHQAPITPYYM
jgi:hypothetical protein